MLQASQSGKDTKKRNVYLNREIFFPVSGVVFSFLYYVKNHHHLFFFIAQ